MAHSLSVRARKSATDVLVIDVQWPMVGGSVEDVHFTCKDEISPLGLGFIHQLGWLKKNQTKRKQKTAQHHKLNLQLLALASHVAIDNPGKH